MEIKPKHLWVAGISLYLLALVCAIIWPSEQSYAEWEKNYIYDLMEARTGVTIDSADRN